MVDEIIWQEHTYEILKQPDVGFGIAISGGLDNPGVQSGDPAIIISDVVKQGPAFNKLQINDTVLRVNNRPTYGLTHQQAVRELKNSGKRVVISVKRKALVRVERTPSPGSLRRSRSRNLDSLPYRHRSRSRDLSPRRHRSRSRDLDSPRSRRHRSRSAGRPYSRSRSRSPRRGRSYSRSRSRSSRHSPRRSRTPSSRSSSRSRSPTPPRKSRSRSRGRSRSRSRSRHRSRSRGRSLTPSSHSASPARSPPVKHRSVDNLRSTSPLSPDPVGTKHGDEMMVFPVKPSEPKPVVLKKTRWNNSYGLKLGTRIFVQDIQPGSLADKNPELKAGDTILMINGRNVDNKSVQEAIQIIGLSKDKLTMLVKKEEGGTVSIPATHFESPSSPEAKHRDKSTERENHATRSHHSSPGRDSVHSSRSRKSSRSLDKKADEPVQVEPKPDPKPDKKTIGGVSVFPVGMPMMVKKNRSVSSQSSHTGSHHSRTPEPAPRSEKVTAKADQPLYDLPPSDAEDGHVLPPDARGITFVKGRNVGIRLAGGNDVGIFVASVQEASPAAKQGLRMGDQILSVNDTDFRNVIREEAVLTLMGLPNGQEVRIVAQPRPEVYNKILEHGTGDSFYIRTHFRYERANDHEMSFKQGSIFRISDTLYQGMVGYWLAVRIGRSNMEIERGVIPNGSRAQQLKEVQDKKIQQAKEKASQGGGIKRRLGKGIGKGKNEKPATGGSPHFPAYERVVLREAGFKRPVVAFGPLSDIARQRLASDFPPTYEIAGNEGTITGQKSNRKGIIRLNTIKDIIEKDKHAILDITPTAVEKLNYAQLYPIVVFLKPESKAAVKELRNKLAVTEEEKRKKPGKLYDRAVKMQKGYSHVCTDIIPLTTVSDDWYRKLHSTIKDQQNMPVWVSEDKLGGTPDEDTEGVVVPGDDDRLSYVSAPASDYSVTTVGSEMLRSNADYDDDEDDDVQTKSGPVISPSGALMPPSRGRKKSSSSSSDEEDAGNKFDDDDLDDALRDEDDDSPPASKPVPPHGYGDPDPMPEAPPRGKKQSTSRERDDASSTSSEERRPVGARPTPMAAAAARTPEASRTVGHQSIPEGRFDPQSFLKNHIRRLNKVKSEEADAPAKQEHSAPQSPRRDDRAVAPVAVTMAHSAPPPREPTPEPPEDTGRYPQPQSYARPGAATSEPLYAQVNKKRPGPEHQMQSQPPPTAQDDRRDHRESSGRDYAGEIDSFISSDPYRSGLPQRRDARPANSRPPVRDEPQPQTSPTKPTDRYGNDFNPSSRHYSGNNQNYGDTGRQSNSLPRTSYQPQQPQNSYNRFAGGAAKPVQPPKGQYQPYSSKPSTYHNANGPPPASDRPPKSQFVQDKYKDYMSQLRQSDNKSTSYNAYNPRPFNKSAGPPSVASKFKNGPVKDQMYDSGVDTYDNAKPKLNQPGPVPVSPSSVDDDDPQVVATARGVFDSNGGVLSSVETGVSIMIPKGAIPTGVKQEIYFKVCKDNTVLPPLDKEKGETLLSPLVMCGPHGLQFNHPVELRLPHCEPSQWQNMNMPSDSNYQVSSNSVSVLIDHF